MNIFKQFDPNLSRISEEMKNLLHLELVGDWFLRKDHSLIWVFGFIGAPLILPVFSNFNHILTGVNEAEITGRY